MSAHIGITFLLTNVWGPDFAHSNSVRDSEAYYQYSRDITIEQLWIMN